MSAAAPPPKTNTPMPPLPRDMLNPKLATLTGDNLPQVKFQVITRENQEIVVGRVKIPHPSGHAFILRRFDTGAISLTTMIRASFPAATDELEKSVCNWVRANYDISGANGPVTSQGKNQLRLAGTWVPSEIGLALAPDYHLSDILQPLITTVPDPAQNYRKSTRSAAASPAGPTVAPPPPTTGPAAGTRSREAPANATPTHPNKRQRVSAPAPPLANSGAPNFLGASIPSGASSATSQTSTTAVAGSPPPPAYTPVSAAQRPGALGGRTLPISPLANGTITADEEAEEDEHQQDADEVSSAALFPTPAEDRADSEALIAQLSAQAPNYATSPIKPPTSISSPSMPVASSSRGRKRPLEVEEPAAVVAFNPAGVHDPAPVAAPTEFERSIVRNRRADAANARRSAELYRFEPESENARRALWSVVGMAFAYAAALGTLYL